MLDEVGHLALGLLVAAGRPRDVARGVVAASVLIDLDHVPSELGHEWLRPGGRGRPYPHTLASVLVAAAMAVVTGRAAWRGATLGLAAHLGRDLADTTSSVRLLWPLSARELRIAPWLYPVAVGALCACGRLRRPARELRSRSGAER